MLADRLRPARRDVKEGRFRKALEYLREHDDERSAEWYLLFAMASWRVGEFAASLGAAGESLDRYRAAGDSDGEMRAQNVAAAGYFVLGRLPEARDGFDRALFLARERSNYLMMARCANNLGNVAYYLGDTDEALQCYNRAAGLFERVGALHGFAEAWHNRGVVLREMGDFDEAKQATDRALDAVHQLQDLRALGWALGGRGETDALLGDLRLGETEVERSAELAREHDDRLTEIEAQRVLAYIARERRDFERAIALGSAALEGALDLGNPWMIAKTRQEVARGYQAMGRPGEATREVLEAARVFDGMGARRRAERLRAAMPGT